MCATAIAAAPRAAAIVHAKRHGCVRRRYARAAVLLSSRRANGARRGARAAAAGTAADLLTLRGPKVGLQRTPKRARNPPTIRLIINTQFSLNC